MMKLGVIGVGNMGRAILEGYVSGNSGKRQDVYVFDACRENSEAVAGLPGVTICGDIREVLENTDVVMLCVKPSNFGEVASDIYDCSCENKHVFISIAAGICIEEIEQLLGGSEVKVIRAMPNMAARIQESMTAVCVNEYVNDEEKAFALDIFRGVGKAEVVSEKLMDAVVGISGSSPAYVFMMIEAMADGACAEGMGRMQAYEFAAQAVMGSAKLVLDSGLHPGELKDMICSPAGTTIEAVSALEEHGFRRAVISAVRAASKKSESMR